MISCTQLLLTSLFKIILLSFQIIIARSLHSYLHQWAKERNCLEKEILKGYLAETLLPVAQGEQVEEKRSLQDNFENISTDRLGEHQSAINEPLLSDKATSNSMSDGKKILYFIS